MTETAEPQVQAVVVQGDVWRGFVAQHRQRQGQGHVCADRSVPACRLIHAVLHGEVPQLGVPRLAAFDDLRVGQWVAWCGLGAGAVEAGKVADLVDGLWKVRDAHGSYFTITERECKAGEVTILRDAPAPPVTVRRGDYDALVAAVGSMGTKYQYDARHDVLLKARALIDNAEVDESCELSWCDSPSMTGARLCADHMGGSLRYEVPDHG